MSDSAIAVFSVVLFVVSYAYLVYYFIMLRASKDILKYLDSLIDLTSNNIVQWRKWKFQEYPWEWVGELASAKLRYHFHISNKSLLWSIAHKCRFLHIYQIPDIDDYGSYGRHIFNISITPAHKLKRLEDAIIKQVGSDLPKEERIINISKL